MINGKSISLSRRVIFVVYDQFELLDLSGPSSVFNAAAQLLKQPAYEIHILSSLGGLVSSCSSVEINSCAVDEFTLGACDSLFIVGGGREAVQNAAADHVLQTWLTKNLTRVERYGSICSGALVLAACGALNGKKATTHWADLAQLIENHHEIEVMQDALYVNDTNVWTSAGVTTGIDMALAIVGQDYSSSVMHEVARWLLVYVHRPGNQSQFSGLLRAQKSHAFCDVLVWLESNLHKPIRVSDMASQVAMTERTFYRKFIEEVGTTPSKFLENRRLFRAKQLLDGGRAIKLVSSEVGYSSELGFRKAFEAQHGLSPALYRRLHYKCTGE